MTTNDKEFIQFVKKECKYFGIKHSLRPVTYIKLSPKIKVAGYFDETSNILAVAMKRPDSLAVLVHEYSHMKQWVEQDPTFVNVGPSCIALDDWLDGKYVKDIKSHIDAVRNMELNNEKRTVELIKKHNLSINIPQYIKRANSYIHFYNYLYISRKWSSPTNSPYKNLKIIGAMSDKFDMKYDTLPKHIEELFASQQI